MPEIKKEELLNVYGIDLPRGEYVIRRNADTYSIYAIKDDTKGCILVGESKMPGRLVNSRAWSDIINSKLIEAEARGEENRIIIIEG